MNEFNLNVRGVAHDLNNQIMILMNALDRVIILCPNDPDAKQAVLAAEHCALLTSQLLPQTRQRPVLDGCSAREIVSEAAMLVRPLMPSSNRLEVACRADCRIAAPSDAIQQALVSLCIHAMDSMDGPGVISINAEHVEGSVIVSVSDTGPGVPEEMRQVIFEPLFTTKSARRGDWPALGRVREIVEESGGTISVGDVAPHGACFRIVLPSVAEKERASR